jgi:hypothetical protein
MLSIFTPRDHDQLHALHLEGREWSSCSLRPEAQLEIER